MNWFNPFGLVFMIIIMIPNIVFAIKCKDCFVNLYHNKAVEILEQVGRYGCFIFMVVNIPPITFGFISDESFALYLILNSILIIIYIIIWIVCFRKTGIFRAASLSVIPSAVFIISGIFMLSIPLIISAIIFTACHITISIKNAKLTQ